MNKIKAIFVDIDWTLLDHAKKPAEFDLISLNALKKAQEKGVLVFLASSRHYHSIEQVGILDLFTPDGIISTNGAEVIFKDQVIYRTKIEEKLFNELCHEANKLDVNVQGIRLFDSFLINYQLENVNRLFATYPERIPDFEDYENQDVIGAMLFVEPKNEYLFEETLNKFDYIWRIHPFALYLSSQYFNKGTGVKFALDYLKIKPSEAAAIGDDLQDISMFKEVEHSFAMGNAILNCQKEAKYITKSVQDHGVKVALEQLNIDTNN